MEFSSLIFLYLFLPIFFIPFFLLRKQAQNICLLLASLVFYAWGESQYVAVLAVSATMNYLLGAAVDKASEQRVRKGLFILSLIFNIGLLFYFKYANFLLNTLGASPLPIHQPLGISFFTFQAISYSVDIYRRTVSHDRSPVRFGTYMTFFPKLLMGPIVPYHNLSKQIAGRELSLDDFAEGVKRFILGLGKKALIADSLAKTANQAFAIPAGEHTAGVAWLGVLFYTLQIYFDFSGYTDMAIGLGRMLGFRLPENFNYPYLADSIKDFWARWHISLANWLRDYLFLPAAYSLLRRIKQDRVLNIKAENWSYYAATFLTFLICGLWHGAAWTFILWGAYYGLLLIIEHAGLRKFIKKKLPPLRYPLTLFLIMMGWVLFRSPDLPYAFRYFAAMFGFGTGDSAIYYTAYYLDSQVVFFLVIAIVGSFPVFPFAARKFAALRETLQARGRRGLNLTLDAGYGLIYNLYLLFVLFTATMSMVSGTYTPFIYFRF